MKKSVVSLVLSAALSSSVVAQDKQPLTYPADYRNTFVNYLSLDRTQNPDQTIRLFANDIAMKGPGPDGKLPFGSVLVAEVYKAKKSADGKIVTSALGRRIRGKFALVAVMQREKGFGEGQPAGIRNGNWEFAAFKPDGSAAGKDLNSCRACHAPLTTLNHVFSYDHLKVD